MSVKFCLSKPSACVNSGLLAATLPDATLQAVSFRGQRVLAPHPRASTGPDLRSPTPPASQFLNIQNTGAEMRIREVCVKYVRSQIPIREGQKIKDSRQVFEAVRDIIL